MSALSIEEPAFVAEVAGLARAYAESQTFVSLLAHELRTLLKVTERALDSPGEEGLAAARESTRTVQDLVESLLEVARGRPGDPADAGLAAAAVVQELRDEIERRDAEIVVGELPVVPLPRVLLETVLRNLVVNALEADASRVEVFARGDGAVCVRDDGAGVSPRNAARIFGVYSGKFGGAGLGLALCREILRRRGGEVWLELPSTFCFRVR